MEGFLLESLSCRMPAAAAGRPLRRSGGIQMKSTPQARRPEGRFFYSHFLCLKNHSSPATSSMLAAMITG